jgi:hypothetical protein
MQSKAKHLLKHWEKLSSVFWRASSFHEYSKKRGANILWSLLKNERLLMPRDLTTSNIPLTLKE